MKNEPAGPENIHLSAAPASGASGALRSQPERGIIGKPEMIALGVAAFLLLVTIGAYFFLLAPARARLEASARERTRLQAALRSADESARTGVSTQVTVTEIVESLRNFEEIGLTSRGESRMAVIEELNDLIRRHSLRISGGLSFTPVDPVAPGAATTAANATRARQQSVFPETAISLSVEGSYQNLRRFIRAIETSRQFVVINSIELESITDTGASRTGGTGATRGALFGLRLEMSAYYRRAGDTQTTASGTQQ